MKIRLIISGKPKDPVTANAIDRYVSKIKKFIPFELSVMQDPRNLSDPARYSQEEWRLLEKKISPDDYVILLDERGKSYSSLEFSAKLQQWMMQRKKSVVFIIGGPYGFTAEANDCAHETLSLSKMTLQHDIASLVFTEQLYRAFTIMRGEKYHH
ncbi:MAG: 23S rRNA (pseudouridine(1915)-N(3))-methyltransferase RlmH [Bacteroidetes bacterium]|nr:23S rRNA (pseudouridine(1915)-N(3))-methyltransferase RlmH [Bacteroidota bacterium]